jgi:hypothetical protein
LTVRRVLRQTSFAEDGKRGHQVCGQVFAFLFPTVIVLEIPLEFIEAADPDTPLLGFDLRIPSEA